MADENDITPLPEPPPPAPVQREVAIAEAMRRFDAAGEATGATKPAAPSRWRHRPALASLVAMSLVLIVAGPIVWQKFSRDEAILPQTTDQRATGNASQPPSPAPMKPEAPSAPAMIAPPPGMNAAPKPAPEAPLAVPPPLALAPQAVPAPAIAPPPPPAPAPPPPPPALAAKAMERESADAAAQNNIVVTATRRHNGPSYGATGDWNACTVDDPRQSLPKCRGQIGHLAPDAAASLSEGLTQAWQGDNGRAIAAFDQTIAKAPNSWLAWLNRGLAKANEGDSAGALADAERAAHLAPGSARAHFALGRMARATGNERRAQSEFDRAAELDPDYDGLEE